MVWFVWICSHCSTYFHLIIIEHFNWIKFLSLNCSNIICSNECSKFLINFMTIEWTSFIEKDFAPTSISKHQYIDDIDIHNDININININNYATHLCTLDWNVIIKIFDIVHSLPLDMIGLFGSKMTIFFQFHKNCFFSTIINCNWHDMIAGKMQYQMSKKWILMMNIVNIWFPDFILC